MPSPPSETLLQTSPADVDERRVHRATRPRTAFSLRGLGIGPLHVLGIALGLAAAAGGGAMTFGCDWPMAAAIAAVAAGAALVTASSLTRVLAREVEAPLGRCTAMLAELRSAETTGRLPEMGAPQVLQLLRALNATSLAVTQRTQSCVVERSAAATAFAGARQVLEQLTVAVLVLGHDGRITFANATAITWLGLPRDTMGRHCRDLLHDAAAAAFAGAFDEVVGGRSPRVRRGDLRVSERHLDLHLVSLANASPDASLVAVWTDATPKRQAQESREHLLTTLSHDLRAKLQQVCSATEVLARMPQDHAGEWREFTEALLREAQQLRTVVDDVVRTEDLHAGRLAMDIASHDLAGLTADAIRLAEQRLDRTGLRFELELAEAAEIRCDGPRTTDVLVRLLHAACDRSRAGEVLHVTVQKLADRAEIVIAQDRPGMPSFTAPNKQTPDVDQSLCRGLLEAMGGSLHREDSPLGGTQFRIVLPLSTAVAH